MAVVSSCKNGVGLQSLQRGAAPTLSCHPQEETLRGLLRITERKVGMTSSQRGLAARSYTRVTMHGTNCLPIPRGKELIRENHARVRIAVCNSITA